MNRAAAVYRASAANRALRPSFALSASIACVATSLAWLAPGTPATRVGTAAAAVRIAASKAAPPRAGTGAATRTGASDVTDLGAGGWRVASSATATQSGR